MKHYEHQAIGAHGDIRAALDQISPEWVFCGTSMLHGIPQWVFAREIPAPAPGAMLMELGEHLRALESEAMSDLMRWNLGRLADCASAIAKGEPVTTEDITGKKPS